MRTARLVGLSADGGSLIVVTDSGEELAVASDERLRAAVRSSPPRPGLETQMDSSLSPREIQGRIRSGQSLEDVVASTGTERDRVERFAAPVLAEREHVALSALAASVRRRGEASGHRTLRATVGERLLAQGIDADEVQWDAYRGEDGRWTVTADHRTLEAGRHAEFRYDIQGRFSVAGDDGARALLGEAPEVAAPDRDDELALVRATREPPADDQPSEQGDETGQAPEQDDAADDEGSDEANEPTIAVVRRLTAIEVDVVTTGAGQQDQAAQLAAGLVEHSHSPLDTLYEMLGGEGHAEESTARAYAGLSDASAVPVTDEHGFVPGPAGVDFPVEPGEDDSAAAPAPPAAPAAAAVESEEPDALIPGPAAPKRPVKRKRAAVPSWDEIMFGGPKPG